MFRIDVEQTPDLAVNKKVYIPSKESEFANFNMNKNYFFLYSSYEIFFFRLDKPFTDDNLLKVNMKMQSSGSVQIKDLRIGADPEIIVIILEERYNPFTILTWSVKDNVELEVCTAEEPFEVLWDYHGNPYIVHEHCVEMTRRRCKVNVYDYQDLNQLEESNMIKQLANDKGQRFDGKNHNWMIFREYLSLPFCYMTFVIKDKIERNDIYQKGNQFDITPYNYIFNKNTCFMDGNIIFIYKELNKVLENFERINPLMLELLHYTQDVMNFKD